MNLRFSHYPFRTTVDWLERIVHHLAYCEIRFRSQGIVILQFTVVHGEGNDENDDDDDDEGCDNDNCHSYFIITIITIIIIM